MSLFLGWEFHNSVDNGYCETNEEIIHRCLRTPSVVVSDYSDYSFLEERLERRNVELDMRNGATLSQASSCSCISCDFCDDSDVQLCRDRRHSDSCCLNNANLSRCASLTQQNFAIISMKNEPPIHN